MDKIDDNRPNGKLSWFAFHFTEFVCETQVLTQSEIGAYILLISHFAQMGSLPTEDDQLARIARCKNVKEWKVIRRSIEPLLSPGGRLATEIGIAHERRAQKIAAARKGGFAKARATHGVSSTSSFSPEQNPAQQQPQPQEGRADYRKSPLSEGRANSLEGSATVQEGASTRGDGARPFGVVDGGRA